MVCSPCSLVVGLDNIMSCKKKHPKQHNTPYHGGIVLLLHSIHIRVCRELGGELSLLLRCMGWKYPIVWVLFYYCTPNISGYAAILPRTLTGENLHTTDKANDRTHAPIMEVFFYYCTPNISGYADTPPRWCALSFVTSVLDLTFDNLICVQKISHTLYNNTPIIEVLFCYSTPYISGYADTPPHSVKKPNARTYYHT
jgi:hypothetical protein